VKIRTALLTVIAAALIVIAARLEYNAHHEAPQFDAGNCMAHLSEMDAATRAECIQDHTINLRDPSSDPDIGALWNGPRPLTKNPEDQRLDARGIK